MLNEDLEDAAVIDRHTRLAGVHLAALYAAIADGNAIAEAREAETIAGTGAFEGRPHG